jgi:hypothetical protein
MTINWIFDDKDKDRKIVKSRLLHYLDELKKEPMVENKLFIDDILEEHVRTRDDLIEIIETILRDPAIVK